MLTAALILALFAFPGVDAACQCFTTQDSTVKGTKASISNAYDPSNFGACYTNACGFIADSGVSTVGWTSITVKFSSQSDPNGNITIYDATTADPRKVITSIKASEAMTSITKPLASSTSSIYVQYSQDTGKDPNQYYGSLLASSGLQVPTSPVPPTTVQTTTPYTSTVFGKNPKTISHDMLILINQKTDQGMNGLNALNNLTQKLVDLLGVTINPDGSSMTRLGLATLTPYTPNFAAQGEIWNMQPSDVKNALPKAGVSSNVDINQALTSVLDAFFSVSSTVAPTRKDVQRSVVLFTAWWNDADLKDVKEAFTAKGVNLAIIGYNTNNPLLVRDDWYNYAILSDATDATVASFVNRFFLNSGYDGNTLTNNWCKKGADQVSEVPNYTIQEPQNYAGPKLGDSSSTWVPTDGQTGRYCNFQDTTYTYNRINMAKKVQVTIFYELEIENDFLKFYADGKEVESFTGIDVSSAYFQVDANVTTARFTTDSAGVMRGFQATFQEV